MRWRQKHVIDALDMLVLNTFTCTAEFTQVAAIEALRDSTNAVPAMVEEYRKRRDLFVEGLNKIPGFRCQSPDGAFYAWVNIEETGLPAEEVQGFCWKKRALLELPEQRLVRKEKIICDFRWSARRTCWKRRWSVLSEFRNGGGRWRRLDRARFAEVLCAGRGRGKPSPYKGDSLWNFGVCHFAEEGEI